MTEFDPADPMPDDDALAMDFALGVLDREARMAAQLRLARDPAFRAEVESWQAMLAPLAEAVAPVTPPPALWDRIAAETSPATTSPAKPRVAPAAAPSLWSSLGLWRGLAAASLALAAIVSVILIERPGRSTQPLLVATLSSPTGGAILTATYDAARGAVILAPAGKSDAEGRTPELWVIEGDKPPRSLGTIDIDTPTSHAIPVERLKGLAVGSTLAISLEPKGGSKTGAPTGPIVATGKLTGI
ncbi:anti-sigma factor [Sphingosinicellaceae bacterium]|nr:anti-sigma factor [Sphingosinicellaceae bacterium]